MWFDNFSEKLMSLKVMSHDDAILGEILPQCYLLRHMYLRESNFETHASYVLSNIFFCKLLKNLFINPVGK